MNEEVAALCCGPIAIISLLLHLSCENFIVPSLKESFYLFVLGSLIIGSAFSLWDIGVKHGNFRLLTVAALSPPITSVFLFVIFGYVSFSVPLLKACLIVGAATAIPVLETYFLKKRISTAN